MTATASASTAVTGGTEYTNQLYANREGQIVARLRPSTGKRLNFYYVNGQPVAQVGNEALGGTQYDYVYRPLSPTYPERTPRAYTVGVGDTLAEIARKMWGDESLWYLIAEANGLTDDSDLVAGNSLTIPNVDAAFHNDANTFKPYDPADVIGNVTPRAKAPPPPKAKSAVLAQVVQVIVTVVATLFLAPAGPGGIAMAAAMGDAAGQTVSLIANGQFDWEKGVTGLMFGGVTGFITSFSPG